MPRLARAVAVANPRTPYLILPLIGELKAYGTFFDELWLIMIALIGGLKPTLHYWGTLGGRGRLELSMVSSELVSRFQGITYGLWAKGCYTEARRGQEFYTETIYK